MTYPLRDWFLDGKDIRREVISADIQSFLGNDATVRPGRNLVDGIEVKGFWIKAYRNLTTNMLQDLKEKSSKWEEESHKSGKRGSPLVRDGARPGKPDAGVVNYQDSHTFRTAPAARPNAGDNSPLVETGSQPSSRQSVPSSLDADMDTRPDHGQDVYRGYPPQHIPPVVPGPYGPQPVFADQHRQPPTGYVQQGEYYVPILPQGEYYMPPGPGSDVPPHARRDLHYPPGYHPSGVHGQREAYDDPRYQQAMRDDRARHQPGREDPRYPSGREEHRDPRHARYPPGREDPRYQQPGMDDPRLQAVRDDPRYQQASDDPRYHGARDDPRYHAGYQQEGGPSYAQSGMYDQYGRRKYIPLDQPIGPVMGRADASRPAYPQAASTMDPGYRPPTGAQVEPPYHNPRERDRPAPPQGNESRRRRI